MAAACIKTGVRIVIYLVERRKEIDPHYMPFRGRNRLACVGRWGACALGGLGQVAWGFPGWNEVTIDPNPLRVGVLGRRRAEVFRAGRSVPRRREMEDRWISISIPCSDTLIGRPPHHR